MPLWRKLHTKVCESFDVNAMPDDFTRLLWVLLPLQLCREGRGPDNASWLRSRVFPLREDVTLDMVNGALDWFADHDMIRRYEVEGRRYFWLPTFGLYQGKRGKEAESIYPAPPDHVSPQDDVGEDQVTDQVHDYSTTKSTTKSTTSHGPSPDLDVDVDIEIDVDVDVEREEKTPAQAPGAPVAPRAKPKRSTRDPRTGHPAIQAAKEVVGGARYPPSEIYDKIIETLGDDCDVGRLQACRLAWIERGYNRNSWVWLTEWYRDGIPRAGPTGGNKNDGVLRGPAAIDQWLQMKQAEEVPRGH